MKFSFLHFQSIPDLAQQTKIKYGTVKDSGVMTFFKNSNIEHFAKMWSQMSEIDPDSMVDNTTEGYKKVRTSAIIVKSSVNSAPKTIPTKTAIVTTTFNITRSANDTTTYQPILHHYY